MDAAFTSYLAEDYVEFGHYMAMSMTAWELSLLECETDSDISTYLYQVEQLFDSIISPLAITSSTIDEPDQTIIRNMNNDDNVAELYR